MSTYDLIIIGAGPAGITAAIYAARKKLRTLVIGGNVGGQALLSSDISNYPSYQFITGAELGRKFSEHLGMFHDVEHKDGQTVRSLSRNADNTFKVRTKKASFKARSLVIASGAKPRTLGVAGEKEFAGKGVFYCAVCDAPLMKNKVAAVIGGGNSAMDAALQLEKIAKKTYLVTINPELRGDEIMKEKILRSKKIEVVYSAQTWRILGKKLVSEVELLARRKRVLKVDGVFVEIGYVPNTDFARGFVQLNRWNEIIADCARATSVTGVFAAGDCTDTPEKQIIIAAGEGAVAALSASKYLLTRKEKKK